MCWHSDRLTAAKISGAPHLRLHLRLRLCPRHTLQTLLQWRFRILVVWPVKARISLAVSIVHLCAVATEIKVSNGCSGQKSDGCFAIVDPSQKITLFCHFQHTIRKFVKSTVEKQYDCNFFVI
jgi:hypothetical protein